MAKSQIIKDIAEGNITLDSALMRSLVIANDLNNNSFKEWIQKELSGYSHNDKIPEYRVVKETFYKFTGTNGSFMYENSPLPLQQILKDMDSKSFYVNIYDGIDGIEKYLMEPEGKESMRDLTYLASEVCKVNGLQCSSIKQIIPLNAFETIISNVKMKLLESLIYLDKMYGSLDNLDVDISVKSAKENSKIKSNIEKYIYEDKSIHIGNNNKIKKSFVERANGNERNEKWYNKFFWKLIIPILVVVIAAIICTFLGINN